jgi:hypothetical protein
VIGPTISHAGVVPADSARAETTWVVAAICIGSAVGCQDAGAFQVFERGGTTGPFTDRGFALCLLPASLAARWFPAGSYPLGTKCPARSR